MKLITPNEGQKKMLKLLLAGGMSLSAAMSGVFITAPSESKRNLSYLDPVGLVTACYGHTGSDVKKNTWYSDQQCLKWFAEDLLDAEKDVDVVIKVPLTMYQKAALIDFDFNIGRTKFARSTMAKTFNKGDYVGGCNMLVDWVYAGKEKLPGLEKRRDLELQFCLGKVGVEDVHD